MKTPSLSATLTTLVLTLLTAVNALAHPGHYHPGEEDEFDALRANYLHLHGNLEIGLALTALAAAVVCIVVRNRRVRIASAIALGGSIALIAAV